MIRKMVIAATLLLVACSTGPLPDYMSHEYQPYAQRSNPYCGDLSRVAYEASLRKKSGEPLDIEAARIRWDASLQAPAADLAKDRVSVAEDVYSVKSDPQVVSAAIYKICMGGHPWRVKPISE